MAGMPFLPMQGARAATRSSSSRSLVLCLVAAAAGFAAAARAQDAVPLPASPAYPAAAPTAAPGPARAPVFAPSSALPAAVDAALRAAKLPASSVTALVVDAGAQQGARLAWQAQALVNPASIMKLVTTYAAVSYTHLRAHET